MKIFAAFPSKYLKAADLHDKHVSAVMSHVLLEELVNKDGADLLPILYFSGVSKGMVLNKTNAKAISEAYTDETEHWVGMPIVLFPAMVAFGAETVEAIRVKAPSKAERSRNWHDGNREALAEHTAQQWEQREGDKLLRAAAARPVPTTAADMERARQVGLARKPTPRPKVAPIQDVMHDADGVVWEEAGERPMTNTEQTEQLTAQLKESLARANEALDAQREARSTSMPVT